MHMYVQEGFPINVAKVNQKLFSQVKQYKYCEIYNCIANISVGFQEKPK